MKIQITDKIFLSSDSQNFMLCTVKKHTSGKKAGQEYLSPYAYYPDVVQALQGLLRQKMRESTATDLKALVRAHIEFCAYLRELLGSQIRREGE